jgi:hypothetical protein
MQDIIIERSLLRTDPRSRYLVFALKVRKLTDSLITLVEDGERDPNLETAIREVVASLETAGGPTSVKSLKKQGPFAHYENVMTLGEVVKPGDREQLVTKLNNVIAARSAEETESNALDAINFFDTLESKALYHHNHPPAAKRA